MPSEHATSSTSLHFVEWFIGGGTTFGTTTCASSEDAPCRQHCPEGCQSTPCEHELVSGDCTVTEWFDNDGLDNCCGYEADVPLRAGRINVRWNGDYYSWEYADARE